jgi:hypothetical protein
MKVLRKNRARFALAIGALGATLVLGFAACGKPKLDAKQCQVVRGKAFAVLNEAANCKTDKDCLTSTWPGCPRESNQDMLDRIKPIKDEYDQGQCEDAKTECPKETPEVWCNQFVCQKREKAIRKDE